METATRNDIMVTETDRGRDAEMRADQGPEDAMEDTMRAIVAREYGTADVLEPATIAVPQIADDEVLVKVAAAGVDRGTEHLMTGTPYPMRLAFGMRSPRNPVPGLDLSGTVVEVGVNVTRFEVGDEVFGIGKGSFAEYTAALEDKLARKPANIDFEHAAAVAVSGLTAIQALRDVGELTAGQHVLIIGASGGVGSFATQIAKSFGAEVTGVASTAKVDFVKGLGADRVIDYTVEDFADGTGRYDVIVDIGGNTTLGRLRSALTESGVLVIVGGESAGPIIGGLDRQLRAMVLSPFVSQKLRTFISKEHYSDMEELAELLASGAIVSPVGKVYALDDAADALRDLAAGDARGKLVIRVRR